MIVIPALAAAGFAISAYLLYTQKAHLKPVCLIGRNCDIVVNSRYSRTFGVENTIFGLLYYGSVFAITFFGVALPPWVLLIAASLAALFSVYLTALQLFVIKGLCDYCMVVNAANIVILALALSNPL